MKKKYPVLAAFERNGEGMLTAWCPYCEKWHYHGEGEGHRIAHCDDGSPFQTTGYILKKVKIPSET